MIKYLLIELLCTVCAAFTMHIPLSRIKQHILTGVIVFLMTDV